MSNAAAPEEFPARGEVVALHYATGLSVRVRWEEGIVQSVQAASAAPLSPHRWIAPGLVDLQVNGYGGVDFQTAGLPAAHLTAAVRRLARDGCRRLLPTLITDTWPGMVQQLRHLRSLRAASPELARAIVGWHIEGPFLSARPGFCGAHDSARMIDPEIRHLSELRPAAGNDPVLLTLAPERANALEFIRHAVQAGIRVSLGHTDASAARLQEAVAAGAVGFTHLGNGCPQELDRHDNILWRVFDTPGLSVGLIPDAAHVSPALFRLIHRALGPAAIYYTADAMAAAGMPPGRYRIGRLELEVGADEIVRLPGSSNFAGSALRPFAGVLRAARMLGCSWREVWDSASATPARMMGLPAGLEPGAPADFCLIDAPPGGEPHLQAGAAGWS